MIQRFRGPYYDDGFFAEDPALTLFSARGNGRLVLLAVPTESGLPGFSRHGAAAWTGVFQPRAAEPHGFDADAVMLEAFPRIGAAPGIGPAPGPPGHRPLPSLRSEAFLESDGPGADESLRDRSLAASRAPRTGHRKLFPDPGLRRIVRWGDFRESLSPQLAEPERLRDAHRVLCFVQVYEAAAAQRWETLTAAVQEDAGAASRLEPLTPENAARLQLIPLLRARPLLPGHGASVPEELRAGDLVFRLQVALDPTLAPEARRPPGRSSGHAAARPPASAARGPRPRGTIPDSLLRPWEFRLSREEAVYDMSAAAGGEGWLGSRLRRWRARFGLRSAWRKWQALLDGKSLDEQLWTVRPPQGRLSHPAVRDWARTTLERAGYDPYAMLAEWEIFWRRKGA